MTELICPACSSQIEAPGPGPAVRCEACGFMLDTEAQSEAAKMDDDSEALIAELRNAFSLRLAEGDSMSVDLFRSRGSARAASRGPGRSAPVANDQTGPLGPGSRLAEFEIIRQIGRGGMGIVYEARQASLERAVALKVLPLVERHGRLAVTRFRNEAHAAGMLNHTNIVPIYAQGEQGGHYYYAMKLVEGNGLDAVIRARPDLLSSTRISRSRVAGRERALPTGARTPAGATLEARNDAAPPQDVAPAAFEGSPTITELHRTRDDYRFIASLLAEVADGLAHAHASGVIHRDIKPHNLILGDDSRLYITDFGLAHLIHEPHLTITGEVMGTPAYLSPEQARGRVDAIDERTDVYSLGVTLYEVITATQPFEGETRDQVLDAVCHQEPRRPRLRDGRIPLDLETICLRAIEKEPTRRYASAAALAEDLRRFADGRPILSRRVTAVERAAKWVRRHKVGSTAIVALVALVVASAGWAASALNAQRQAQAARRLEANELVQDAYDRLVHVDFQDPASSAEKLARAAALGASGSTFELALALVEVATDTPDEAIPRLEQLSAAEPVDTESLYALAWAQWGADRFQESRAAFARADALGGPATAEGWFFRGLAAQRIDPAVALDSYRQAIAARSAVGEQFPQAGLHLARAHNQMLYVHRTLGSLDEAERTLQELISHGYYGGYPHYLLSIAYRLAAETYEGMVGRDRTAQDYYQKALDAALAGELADPKENRPVTAEAECLESWGRFEEALDARNRAIALSDREDHLCEGYHYRWRLRYWLGHHEEALLDLDRHLACIRDETDPEVLRRALFYEYFYPALVRAEAGDMEAALASARSLAEIEPRDAQATLLAAACLRVLGRAEEASDLLLDRRGELDFGLGLVPSQTPEWAEALYAYSLGELGFPELEQLAEESPTPWKLLGEAHFHAGTKALSGGDRLGALDHFTHAYRSFDGWVNYTFHGRMLQVRLAEDPDWPVWIETAGTIAAPADRRGS